MDMLTGCKSERDRKQTKSNMTKFDKDDARLFVSGDRKLIILNFQACHKFSLKSGDHVTLYYEAVPPIAKIGIKPTAQKDDRAAYKLIGQELGFGSLFISCPEFIDFYQLLERNSGEGYLFWWDSGQEMLIETVPKKNEK